MIPAQVIEAKRDGRTLDAATLRSFFLEFNRGAIEDYHMAALLMAIFFRGLDQDELDVLTTVMIESGETLAAPSNRPWIDKHSTGGVGDKVSLVLAPLVASLGISIPMMSGRGLGHTGGTLDKLESIPGFRTDLTLEQASQQIADIGCALLGQTDSIAPLDKRLYALRDVTGTVNSIPLIAASIMSKKIAEGATGLVLDVKHGSGAFLPGTDDAVTLAKTMVAIGKARGCETVALLTAMDRPLGRAVGNALEVEEAVAVLNGEGPADVLEVTMALGTEMVCLAEPECQRQEAANRLTDALRSGLATKKFQEVIEAQGGNPLVVSDPGALPQAAIRSVFRAPTSGVVSAIHPKSLGYGLIELGGGRRATDDDIDPSVGFHISVQVGERLEQGQPIASVYANSELEVGVGVEVVAQAIEIGDRSQVNQLPLIGRRIDL